MASLQVVLGNVNVYCDHSLCPVFAEEAHALLVNVPDPALVNELAQLGVTTVDKVLFTHHRRELADGLDQLTSVYSPTVLVPDREKELFQRPASYWQDPDTRWDLQISRHVPYHVTHIRPIEFADALVPGDRFQWRGWDITVESTPGYTDGSVSYCFRKNGKVVICCGDLIAGPGQILDLYSLQHFDERNGHEVGDYHGFMGSVETVKNSLKTLLALHPDVLIPAHGDVITEPEQAINSLIERLDALYRQYTRVSALRWYFPDYFATFADDPEAMPFAEQSPVPGNVEQINGSTTWLLKSANQRAILVDPTAQESLDAVEQKILDGELKGIDWIWITHYHWDHLLNAARAAEMFNCPVTTDAILADVIEKPLSYYLTCLMDCPLEVAYPRAHGETWHWENFALTSYHFPGQTYYHSGLLAVEGGGTRLFFCGDSFSPSGIDDYCTWNRNWLGQGVGHRKCIDILQQVKPDFVFNQHVACAFRFTDDAYEQMVANLIDREKMLAELLPWEHPNLGTDEAWCHTYPYEQKVRPGETFSVAIKLFNHHCQPVPVKVGLVLPPEWHCDCRELVAVALAKQELTLSFQLSSPLSVETPVKRVVPVEIWWNERRLGSFREFIVNLV